MNTIGELGPSKLQDDERQLVRDAADTLIFSADPHTDIAAGLALSGIACLCRTLVDSGRWEPITAMRLMGDIADCGGIEEPERQAA